MRSCILSDKNTHLKEGQSPLHHVDVRHLEEATNTLIYTERAYGASYKPDAFKPHSNLFDSSYQKELFLR